MLRYWFVNLYIFDNFVSSWCWCCLYSSLYKLHQS